MKVDIGPYEDNIEDRHVNIEFIDSDFWNLDHTLSLIIHKALLEYKSRLGVGSSALSDGNFVGVIPEKDFDEMIEGFSLIADPGNAMCGPEEMLKIRNALELFSKHYLSLWT